MVYMITYDLHNATADDYDALYKAIDECALNNTPVCYWQSSFLVKSNETARAIIDHINSAVTVDSNLLVIEVTSNWVSWFNQTTDETKAINEINGLFR